MIAAAAGTAIYATLAADAALAAVVGDRIYPGTLPDRPTFPAIVYDVDLDVYERHDQAAAGLSAEYDCEFTIYSRENAADARAIADLLAAAVLGIVGDFNGKTFSGPRVTLIDRPDWDPKSETWQLDIEIAGEIG